MPPTKINKPVRPARKPAAKPKAAMPEPVAKSPARYIEAVGRRKTATARVRLYDGEPFRIAVNDRPLANYFPDPELHDLVESPIKLLAITPKFSVTAKVSGGGIAGQAEAVRHGLSRALSLMNPDDRSRLKKRGFLRRDPRMKERKKYGLKGARRAPQWQKR